MKGINFCISMKGTEILIEKAKSCGSGLRKIQT
jgi:hypothetical protein